MFSSTISVQRKNQIQKPNKLTVVFLASMPDKGMKSLGNKSLIKIDTKTILDHQIHHIQKAYKNANIIVVCGFESKRFSKLMVNTKNISIIEHDIDDYTNFGRSLREAITNIDYDSDIIFINSNAIISYDMINQLNYNQSFVIVNNNNKFDSPIGCTFNKDKIEYIFYDLKYKICEFFYFNNQDTKILRSVISKATDNQYIFELINLCISLGMRLVPSIVNTDRVIFYDNINKIKKIKKVLTNV